VDAWPLQDALNKTLIDLLAAADTNGFPIFKAFGFSKLMRHRDRALDLYAQNDIVFLLNRDPNSFGAGFAKMHGPSVCAMGWRARDAGDAMGTAVQRGARGQAARQQGVLG
jgi:4-hydroxyphenylpyruvate dioxygenase-like putative hemolysin